MITRFAPSPTGPLHLGHAFSALTVWAEAKRQSGTALLRIEDTDSTRVRPEHEAAIYEDLAWLGLHWPAPVRRQSEHYGEYWQALEQLDGLGLIYPCACSRRDIMDAGAVHGVEGMVYPGTCRNRSMREAVDTDAIRLDISKAIATLRAPLGYTETGTNSGVMSIPATMLITEIGDPVLRRKDTGDPAYHLACVHDDALQAVTHVVRGTDLQALTPLHVLLQRLLDYPTPVYHHHSLVRGSDGKRLAKIDKSKALARYRTEGATPSDIFAMVGLSP